MITRVKETYILEQLILKFDLNFKDARLFLAFYLYKINNPSKKFFKNSLSRACNTHPAVISRKLKQFCQKGLLNEVNSDYSLTSQVLEVINNENITFT